MSNFLLRHSICILPILASKRHTSECEYPKHKINYKKPFVPGWTYLDTDIDQEMIRILNLIK